MWKEITAYSYKMPKKREIHSYIHYISEYKTHSHRHTRTRCAHVRTKVNSERKIFNLEYNKPRTTVKHTFTHTNRERKKESKSTSITFHMLGYIRYWSYCCCCWWGAAQRSIGNGVQVGWSVILFVGNKLFTNKNIKIEPFRMKWGKPNKRASQPASQSSS